MSAKFLWVAPLAVRVGEMAAVLECGGLQGLGRITGPWAVALRIDGASSARPRASCGRGPAGQTSGGVPGNSAPAADEIIVAHDPTGIMPLYWDRLDDGGVAVSDHLPTLALEPGVDCTIHPDRVALRYAGGGTNPGWLGMSMTDYHHIHAVPFGHAIAVAPDGAVRQVKFRDPAEVGLPDESMTPEAAAEALRGAIDRAVARAVAAAIEAGPAVVADVGGQGSASSTANVAAPGDGPADGAVTPTGSDLNSGGPPEGASPASGVAGPGSASSGPHVTHRPARPAAPRHRGR